MILPNAPAGTEIIVLELLALFLTVATIWIMQVLNPKEIDFRSFLVLITVIIPFVMVIYFGLAIIICNEMVARSGRPILPLEPTLRKIVPATVTYIGLSAWVWLRWRKLRP